MRKSLYSFFSGPDFEHFERGTYLTMHLKESQGLLLATTCSSKAFPAGGFHLFDYRQQLLNARSESEAESELHEKVVPEIVHLASNLIEPKAPYSIQLQLAPDEKSGMAEVHLRAQLGHLSDEVLPLLERTVRDYKFLLEFGVTNPSVLLAGIYRVQTKTVQQRLYLARKQNLITSLGRGRTQSEERKTEIAKKN